MKKLAVTMGILLVALSAAMAATNEVTSVNAVGFIRTSIPGGGWGLISLPFVRLDGQEGSTIPELFPDAPNLTQVWFYQNGAWDKQEKRALGGWSAGTNTFIRGDGLFIKAPGATPVTYTVMGEVPDSRSGSETTTVFLASGYTLMGFPYPTDIALSNTTLYAGAAKLDAIWYWDQSLNGGAGGWNKNENRTFGGWQDKAFVFGAGKGYMYQAKSTDLDWVEEKPYSWPK